MPVLLTEDMVESMDILLNTRQSCGILPANKFFFALAGSMGHLRFFNVLKSVAARAGLKRPELLSTTRMRKYLATMAQVDKLCDCVSAG